MTTEIRRMLTAAVCVAFPILLLPAASCPQPSSGMGQELVVNGDFSNGSSAWTCAHAICCAPFGTCEVVDCAARIHREGAGSSGGGTWLYQDLNEDVNDAGKLTIAFNVRVDYQSLPGLGYEDEEAPAYVQIKYVGVNGESTYAYWAFYYKGDSHNPDAEKIPQSTWISRSYDLTLLSPKPAVIERVYAVASGWDYNSRFDNISIIYEPAPVPATVDIRPDVLNPRSGGRWVTCYIELPQGYDPGQIDVSTVVLNETVPAEMEPTEVGDYDEDGVPDRMVKFSRSEVIHILPSGEHVEVRVTGEVAGEPFAGADTIRVLVPKITHPNGGEAFDIGEECTISWEIPEGYQPEWYDIYYTSDDGSSWNVISEDVIGTSRTWVIPDVQSDRCRVLVEAHDALGIMGYDISDQIFITGSAGAPTGGVTPTCFAFYPTDANPSTKGAGFQLDLPKACPVRVAVHDVRGRLVRELIDDVRPPDSYSVQWDGKDSFGAEARSGIYFVRLEAGQYVATGKIALVH